MDRTSTKHVRPITLFLLLALCLMLPVSSKAQQLKNLIGTVTDAATGEPIPAVTIKVKRTNAVVATGANGKYGLKVSNADVLTFSYLGYEVKTLTVGEKTILNVALKPTINSLNELVVIGYGSVKKSELVGSVGQVNMQDIAKAPVSSFAEALAGRVAGVQVSSADGQPGSGMDIVIRGANSLTQSNTPLYVIDGFPIEDADAAALNPDDIETINILKDASATAIYGSRAANGVILIETKKGKVGKPIVSLNSSVGFQEVSKQMELMSPYEFVKYQYEFNPVTATARYLTGGRTIESYKDREAIDWQGLIFRKSPTMINNIALRGGNTATKYALSGSIYDQKGIIINTDYNRYQGRVAVDQIISKKFKAGVIANYSKITTFGQQVADGNGTSFTSYLLTRVWGYRPVSGNVDVDLVEEESDADNVNQFDIRLNPIITSNNDYTKSKTADLLANGYIDYAITSNLTLRAMGSVSSKQRRRDIFYNSKTPQGSPLNILNTKGINGSVLFTEGDTWSNDNTLTYNKTFNKIHKLTALAGLSFQGTNSSAYGYYAQGLPNEQLGLSGLDEGIPYLGVASESNNTMVSAFGRVSYGYKSKYLVEGTLRADASSKFAAGHKWGYFPSASFAWNMHLENFMKELTVVSNSKLRLSYGSSGNNRVGDFDYFSRLAFPLGSSYSFNNGQPSQAVILSTPGNLDLKWETTKQLNVGYDLGLFKNRIEFTVDLYKKITSDLLLLADLPATSGFIKAPKNIGKIQNQGIEFGLNTINIKNKSFSWTSNFNISFNQNKILELVENQDYLPAVATFESQYNSAPLYIARIGQPAGMMYGYLFDGIYQYSDFENPAPGRYVLKSNVSTNGNLANVIQPGDIKYKDLNGDGGIDGYDMAVIGRGQPIHTGGFSNNFSYMNFDLNLFFQWSYGNQIYNANRLMFEGNGNVRTDLNQFASYVNRWSPENQTNENFRANGQGPIGLHSSRVVEDGSYLRLKTFSLAYNIPPKFLKMFYLTRLRFNVSAQNLLTFTKYSGMDPEVSVRNNVQTPGFDFSGYPRAKTIVFGLNATF